MTMPASPRSQSPLEDSRAGLKAETRAPTFCSSTPPAITSGAFCHWRECRPGIRLACDARHCGSRPFLHDDLDDLRLEPALAKAPPVEIWPKIVRRVDLPSDVETLLVRPLESSR